MIVDDSKAEDDSNILLFIHFNVCLHFAYHMCDGAQGGQKRVMNPWIWSYMKLWTDVGARIHW